MDRSRVGIFQASWPMQAQTMNLVRSFLSDGFDVDVFLFNVSEKYEAVNVDNEGYANQLGIHRFTAPAVTNEDEPVDQNRRSFLKRLIKKVFRHMPVIYRSLEQIEAFRSIAQKRIHDRFFIQDRDILPGFLFDQTKSIMTGIHYCCLVGIERYGLVWAGHLARQLKIPLIYWSLELYTRDFARLKEKKDFMISKRLEGRYHRQANATIVQDSDRAGVLMKDNRVVSTELLFVPVSLLGPPHPEKTDYLSKLLKIPAEKRVILYFGMMAPFRHTHEVVKIAQEFPKEWALVVHGPCESQDYLNQLHQMNNNHRVWISTDPIPQAEICDLIASADIGLVFYARDNQNDLLTGRSSEKVALYAQAGVPMIAYDTPSFRNVFDQYRCGECITSMDDIGDAVDKILRRYPEYRAGALLSYEEIYEFSRHYSKVIEWIHKL